MLRRSSATGLLLALVVATPAFAQSTIIDAVRGQLYVFASVEAYEVDEGAVLITGVLQGESETKRIRFGAWSFGDSGYYDLSRRCERLALMSLAKPGRYLLTVTSAKYYWSDPPPLCKLALIR